MTDDDQMLILDSLGRLEAALCRVERNAALMEMDLARFRMEFTHGLASLKMDMRMWLTELTQEAEQQRLMAAHRRRMLDARVARLRRQGGPAGPDPVA